MCNGNNDWGDCPCQNEPDVGFTVNYSSKPIPKKKKPKPKPKPKSTTPMSDLVGSDFWDDYI